VIRGEHVVVDASLFHAYSNPQKKNASGTLSESDASWAKETSTCQWVFGYKLHVISCADPELPIALAVTTGKRNEGPSFHSSSGRPLGSPSPCASWERTATTTQPRTTWRLTGWAPPPLSLPDRGHRKPRTLAQRLRLHPIIKRGSHLYKKRKQQSIERVFSRLKNHFSLDNLKVRALASVKPHVFLSLTCMLIYALTEAKHGPKKLVRSPTRLTA
jgi:hypothetical protein